MTNHQRRNLLIAVTAATAVLGLVGGVAAGNALWSDGGDGTEIADTETAGAGAGGTTSTTAASPAESTTTTSGAGDSGAPGSGDGDGGSPTPGSDGSDSGDAGGYDGITGDGPGGLSCAGPYRQGTWDVDGPGDAAEVTAFEAFGGPCAGITLRFAGDAPDASVERYPEINTTVVKLHHAGDPPGPVDPDLWDFETIDGRIGRAVLVHEDSGLAVVLSHPTHLGDDLGAHVTASGDRIDVRVRNRTGDDPAPTAHYEGEPYQLIMRGPFWEGLLLTHAIDVEGSGTVAVRGYAKPFESTLEVHLYDKDDGTEVCGETTMTSGPMYLFSAYEVTCPGLAPGTYDVEVGWPGVAGPDDAVWYLDEVEVGG